MSEPMMPRAVCAYVRWVEAVGWFVGRVTMFMIFAMIAVLVWSSVSKSFLIPSLWTLEIAQFLMVSYFLLGGAYAMQLGDHVRMDLAYGAWSPRTKAAVDAVTILFLIFYIVILLYGGISSTIYAIAYGERAYSAWRPYMWPIKVIMCAGIALMLLQSIATFFRDLADALGRSVGTPRLEETAADVPGHQPSADHRPEARS
ncbi:TRAP transporter small permease subunit [Acuticoccus sp. M5D2P5]|uniref:TRAP transporter small permease subunit n=1 Tax=Acuticoccus kalidii TaxID=2910977 RepID=UPI001F41C7B4|nr:TRAP transporter small permease subunit [Acuticoccus kalidii]MCF3936375.1 TRAP transporter small permease subunit [Acuticoccus kalidii]